MTQEPWPDSSDSAGAASPPPNAEQDKARAHLREALRRARADDAERVGVQAQNRELELVRLELLQSALAPLFAQLAEDELFDLGLMPGVKPRLFIDMIGFVEMGGGRVYRLVQDRRFGRTILGETEDIARMVEMVTDYVARRMLEREKALAGGADQAPAAPLPQGAPAPRSATARLAVGFAVLIDVLGAIAFFSLIALSVWLVLEHFGGGVSPSP